VATQRFRPPFAPELCHWVPEALDLAAMRRAAAALVGRHDFSAFTNAGSPRLDNVRTLAALRIVARRRRFAVFLQGNGFLYNMARTIAGTLIEVGRGKLSAADVPAILAAGLREDAGPTAPAAGLYLVAVRYAERPFAGRDRGPHGAPGVFQ
jgi:tRNA pseudouridine38-40 synthase